jgi:CXXX repeat radical SAM target protein
MKKERNEELQSRREFFKNAAKGVLPILGAIALANMPGIANAAEVAMGCTGGTCSGGCSGGCDASCKFHCNITCKGICKDDCSTTCKAVCRNACNAGDYK